MTWYKDKHGLAAFEDLSINEMDRRANEEGVNFYASLGGLIINEGIQATSISAFRAEKLFDGIVALRLETTVDLEPVDTVARYDIEIFDDLNHPCRVEGETVRQAYWQAELERTGEREYSVGILEIPEANAKLFFTGESRRDVETQAAEAARRIYPEEESLYTAMAAHDLVLSRGYARGRPGDAVIARFVEGNRRISFFLGEDSQELAAKVMRDIGGRPGEDIIDFVGRRPDIDFDLGFMSHNHGHIERAIELRRETEATPDMSM